MAITQALTVTALARDTGKNATKVRIQWTSAQTGTSGGTAARSGFYYISVNDGTETEYAVTAALTADATVNVLLTDLWVPHTMTGQGKIRVRTYMDTGDTSQRYIRLEKALTLTTIDRETEVSASTSYIGGTCTVGMAKKSPAYTHSVAYTFGTLSGWIDGQGTQVAQERIFSDSAVTLTIPNDWYGEIPNARQGTCTLTCTTYDGTRQVGTPQSYSFTVQVQESLCTPALTLTAEDTNSATIALTGNAAILVDNASTVRCTAAAQAKNGAQIATLVLNGQEIQGTSAETTQTRDLYAQVTDSRGFTRKVTAGNTVVAYEKPTCRATMTRVSDAQNDIHIEAAGTWFSGNFGQNANTLRATFCVNNGTQTTVPVTVSGNGFTIAYTLENALSYESSAVATLRIIDGLNTVIRQAGIPAGVPVFDWGSDGFAFHVPVSICNESLLDYVIAQGTQDEWNYRKWHSGRMELWGRFSMTVSGFFSGSGHYLSNETFGRRYPISFTEAPTETAMVSSPDGWLILMATNTATRYSTAYYRPCSLEATSLTDCTVTVSAVGKWK